MIVAGEASGDMHGANLIREMKKMAQVRVYGMGGKDLATQGVEILFDASRLAVVGLSEVFSHLGDLRKAQRVLAKRLESNRPALLILIDFPDFNLMLAKKAKLLGIPVFYYISPQVWAWRSGRVKKISRLVDKMAVILPFEEAFYKQRGMDVEFVGHPLLDTVKRQTDPEDFLASLGIRGGGQRIVGLLPGSRRKEIRTMLPLFLAAAKRIQKSIPETLFLLPIASTITLDELNESGLAQSTVPVIPVEGHRYDLMAACEVVMAASGTVTLELGILGIPMVVSYRVSPLSYAIIKRLSQSKYISLLNLVAGCQVVPELIQDAATPESLSEALVTLLSDKAQSSKMKEEIAWVIGMLGERGASSRVAQLALALASDQTRISH
ncbi:MAG: lipid-A-disaccharide synthase [Proteobacteria bacterium]|nr:lipid-A-disaccharide synthase [Pseudomonadota bacterium]MBU1686531.1 lipid-A-disaccharide synthase [Pseudomonadota bacterium]